MFKVTLKGKLIIESNYFTYVRDWVRVNHGDYLVHIGDRKLNRPDFLLIRVLHIIVTKEDLVKIAKGKITHLYKEKNFFWGVRLVNRHRDYILFVTCLRREFYPRLLTTYGGYSETSEMYKIFIGDNVLFNKTARDLL